MHLSCRQGREEPGVNITFKLRTHPGEPKDRNSPGCDPYVESYELKADGRGRIWSVGVKAKCDELAAMIAEELEESPC